MKKNAKTNRKSRTSTSSGSQKLFRNGSQGFEALEPRQMLDAGLTNALFDTAIPYTEDALTHQSATVLTVKPTSDTAADGSSIYAGIRIYGVNENATGDVASIKNVANGFTISKIEQVNPDGTKTAIGLLDAGGNVQNSYSFACAQMLLGQEYSITVSWNGTGDAPKFGAIAYLLGDTDAFASPDMAGNALPATDSQGNYIANQQSNINNNEVNLIKAAIMLDDPQTNWQHDQAINLLNSTGFTETDTYLFSLDSNTRWDASDLTRVQTNQGAGNVNFNMTFDQEAPGLAVTVADAAGKFAGTAIVSPGSKTDKTEHYACDVDTSAANPFLTLNFADEISAIKSIGISTTDGSYNTSYWTSIGGDSKTETVTLDLASYLGSALTDGTYKCYIQAIDAIGNTAIYVFNVNYKAAAEFNVDNGSSVISGNNDGENVSATKENTADEITVTINPNLNGGTEGNVTKQRMGIQYNGTMYYTQYKEYTNNGADPWGKDTPNLSDFAGLSEAMGASNGVIPDGTYVFTAFIQDSFGHDPQQVGVPQTLVIDTAAPEFTFRVNDKTGTSFSLLDDAQSDVVVTLDAADATAVTLTLTDANGKTIAAGSTVADAMTITNVYGEKEYTLTATDAAGNVVTKTFKVYLNNAPTAGDFAVELDEAQTGDISIANGELLNFADNVADANTADSTLTVSIDPPANGKLCVLNGATLETLVASNGKISFTADKTIYYVPNIYWNGAETLTYTVTDNFGTAFTGQTSAMSAQKSVIITVNAINTEIINLTSIEPEAVDEDSDAPDNGVVVATFAYPTNEARTFTAAATWTAPNINKLNAGGGTDATSLFSTAPTFTVVADGEPVNGVQKYNVVMDSWVLSNDLWGSEKFQLTITDSVITADTGVMTFTVTSQNDAPVVDTTDPLKTYNVSLSTLAKGAVTLVITDDMYSDVDDADADLTIAKITIGGTEIEQGASKVITVNGVDVTFTLTGKNIVISQNTDKALDKGTLTFAITVSDPDGSTASSGDNQLSTIKFSAYASDDTLNIKEDAAATEFNVLANDKTNSENWDGKTFEISQVNGAAAAVNEEIALTVDGKTAGVLKVLDLATTENEEYNFSFTPAADWNGTVTFEYTIVNTSNATETATATVTINVEAVNDYPTYGWYLAYVTPDAYDPNTGTVTTSERQSEDPIGYTPIGIYNDIDTAADVLKSIVNGNAAMVQDGKIYASAENPNPSKCDLINEWSFEILDSAQANRTYDYLNLTSNQYLLVLVSSFKTNAWGEATLTFTPTDDAPEDSQGTAPAVHTLKIVVYPVNDAPVANDKTITIDEDADYTEITLEYGKDKDIYDVESPKSNLFLHVKAPTNGTLYIRSGEGTLESPYAYTAVSYTEGVSDWMQPTTQIFYKPNENYFGTDAFLYQIKDTLDDSGATSGEAAVSGFATFMVNVTAVNDPPVFAPNTTDFTLADSGDDAGKYVIKTPLLEDATSVTINLGKVSDVDTALSRIQISTQTVATKGTKSNDNNNATADIALFEVPPTFAINTETGELVMTYKLAKDVSGYADITIQVDDQESANNLSEIFNFKLIVNPVNDAPTTTIAAWNISIGALEDAATGITYDLAQNASDVEGDTLTFSEVKLDNTTLTSAAQNITIGEGENAVVVSASISGSVVTLTYVSGNIEKLDKQVLALTFTVSDGALSTAGTGAVKFTAYTQDDSAAFDQVDAAGTERSIDVLANDHANWGDKTFAIYGVGNDSSMIVPLESGTTVTVDGGEIGLSADGTKLVYTQKADYRGSFSFVYQIREVGGTETADGTVTVLVKAINAAPTAGQVDAEIDESQTGTDKVKLDFAAGVADRETADANLTITIAENAVTNGALVDSTGVALSAVDGKYSFAATAEVYFQPNQYFNGSVTIAYTVTDRLDDLSSFTLVDGQTVKTAASNAVVVITAVGTTPTVSSTDKDVDEDSTGTSVKVGTASMPTGAEKLDSVSFVTKGTIIAHKSAGDSLEALLADGYDFTLNTDTGEITFNYELLENVYGSQTFTITVTTAEGGTTSFDWTFTVNSVNDAPTAGAIPMYELEWLPESEGSIDGNWLIDIDFPANVSDIEDADDALTILVKKSDADDKLVIANVDNDGVTVLVPLSTAGVDTTLEGYWAIPASANLKYLANDYLAYTEANVETLSPISLTYKVQDTQGAFSDEMTISDSNAASADLLEAKSVNWVKTVQLVGKTKSICVGTFTHPGGNVTFSVDNWDADFFKSKPNFTIKQTSKGSHIYAIYLTSYSLQPDVKINDTTNINLSITHNGAAWSSNVGKQTFKVVNKAMYAPALPEISLTNSPYKTINQNGTITLTVTRAQLEALITSNAGYDPYGQAIDFGFTVSGSTGWTETGEGDTQTFTWTGAADVNVVLNYSAIATNADLPEGSNTISSSSTITFTPNEAPVINNFSGNKTIDSSVNFGDGSWILFNKNDVNDPDANSASIHIDVQSHTDTSALSSFAVSKDASGNYVLSYNVLQGVFGAGYVDVTLTEKLGDGTDGDSATYRYVLSVTNVISIPLLTDGDDNDQKDVTADNPLYIDFTNSGLTTSNANSLDLNKLFGSDAADAHTYTVKYGFSGGADHQKTSSSNAAEYWTVSPTGTNVSTEATDYPVYKNGAIVTDGSGNPLFWTLTPSSKNTKAVSASYSGSDYAVMVRPSAANTVPVTGTITGGNLELKLNRYSALQDNSGSLTITRDDGVAITININITPETTYNLQWFITDSITASDLAKNSNKSVSLENWSATTARKNNGLEYNDEHVLMVYANDQFIEWANRASTDNMVSTFLLRIDFGGSVDLDPDSDYNVFNTTGFQTLYQWNEDHSVLELGYFAGGTANRANLADFRWLGEIHYSYADDTGTQILSASVRSVIRTSTYDASKIMNSLQVSAGFAEGTNPASGAGLYGTESAKQTKVEGTGVYMQLSAQQPTEQTQQNLPKSETWIHEWQSHYVNMYANTQDATIIDGRIYYELNYDSQYFTATDFIASDALENSGFVLREGKVYVTGVVNNLDASNGFILLGSVKFEALEDNNVAADTVGSVDMGLSLSNIILNDADGNQIEVNTQTVVDTQLLAVVYDADDSGAIDLNDFTYFAMNFDVNTVVSNNTLAWAMDFDKSGKVDLNDFTAFAVNFGASRENGQAVQFPEGFEQQYIGTKLEGDGDAQLSELVEKAVQEWETKLGIELNVSIQLKVTDFSDAKLGESYIVSLSGKGTPEIGTITLDANAAGLNWSINTADVADGQYDLYTVILHEVGHLLGYTDQYSAFDAIARGDAAIVGSHTTDSSDLMYETINPGERKEVSDADAKTVSDAYDYAKTNGASLTYVGSSDLAAAITGAVSAMPTQPEAAVTLASNIVKQEDWTATLETKVLEALNKIANENRDSVFTEADSPILEDFNADDFAFDLAGNQAEDNGLFDDLSWISDDSAPAEEKLEVELGQLL